MQLPLQTKHWRAGVPCRTPQNTLYFKLSCSEPRVASCSCKEQQGRTATAAVSAAGSRRCRRSVAVHAWFTGQQQSRQLWDYQGSNVRRLSLEELQMLHRLSFGHRNQRSYLIVLHTPDSPACQEFEQEVERLATGLRHERALVVAALDTSTRTAAHFASDLLGVKSVPAVLLYPEAARGFLRFLGPDMSATGMLAAINKARIAAWPPSRSSPGAREWQLLESSTPLAVTALRAAAAAGDREAVAAKLQQQMKPIVPTPLPATQTTQFWSQGRMMLWGGMLLLSGAMLAWDLALADAWEDWCLARRQAERARGKKFTLQENLDDLTAMMMRGLQQQDKQAADPPEVEAEQVQQQQQQSSWQTQSPHGNGSTAQQFARLPEQEQQQQQQHIQQQQDIQMLQQEGGEWVAEPSPAAIKNPRKL